MRLTIRKQYPAHKKHNHNHRLAQLNLRTRRTIQHIRPILRRKNLPNRQKRIPHLAKIRGFARRIVASEKLESDERGDVVDENEEE